MSLKRKDFTPQEVELIKLYYLKNRKLLLKLLSGRSPKTITHKANSIGLRLRINIAKWTTQQVNWLKENYSTASDQELLNQLSDKTLNQIVNKANSLKLKRRFTPKVVEALIDGKLQQAKACTKCKSIQPLSKFKKVNRNQGYNSHCKDCEWKSEKQRRKNLSPEKKDEIRLKDKLYKREDRAINPEKHKRVQQRYYRKNKSILNSKQREYYSNNRELFKQSNASWRSKHRQAIYIRNLNRKALKRDLPYLLTKKDLQKLSPNGIQECALTGHTGKLQLDHFIPLAWGHGGTYIGNMLYLMPELNMSKKDKNPFEWLNQDDVKSQMDQNRVNMLIRRLSDDNELSVEAFKEYVYWCEANKGSLQQSIYESSVEAWKASKGNAPT